ncbi:dephospho-CoA kinase [Paenibacillus sp. SYP-B4298]|uniref:dephospho-CoA kinase n=1 Tax=Paenibacillus sp. SYP-B4298 TaxID=2996034 RepID=UPI0022DE25B9|nr:dephospho-CoA kinase [Paenibacillus sp. SYP-B4298]
MKIGLTGGIACGKSTVGAMLVQLGAALVDADQVAREVVLPGEPALGKIVAAFGSEVLHADGSLNRGALGNIVFQNPGKRRELESIVHPAIRERMKEQIQQHEEQSPGIPVIADVPLLYETGQDKQYEQVIVVYIPRELQLKRLMERNPDLTKDQALGRIEAQLDIEEKRRRASWVIDNSGDIEATRLQVEALWGRIVPC